MRPALLFLLLLTACTPEKVASGVRHGAPEGGDDTAATEDTDTGSPEDSGDSGDSTDSHQDTDDDTGLDPDDDGTAPVGIDVSHWDGEIDWSQVADDGVAFSFAKASEGTYYSADAFESEDEGAAGVGLLHGAYHFAIPDDSDGAEQADFFILYGGGWANDGLTLPGVLDIEYNPYGDTCYDLSKSEMAAWIADFTEEYKAITGRAAIIYTTADWWNSCVGSEAFGATNPMWVAHYDVSSPTVPDGWSTYSFWQYTSTGDVSGIEVGCDMNLYNGTLTALRDYATGD